MPTRAKRSVPGFQETCLFDFNFKKLKQRLNEIKEPNGPIPLLGVEIGFRVDLLDKLYSWINSEDFDKLDEVERVYINKRIYV